MLVERYGYDSQSAGTYYALPYIISGIASPILGIIIDKQGKKALFITVSSALILVACLWTIFIPVSGSYETTANYLCLGPLCILGIGYSVYAAALWSCIPYTVPNRLVGTAYGICTAI